jgi:uncharacterized protein (DUF486 family)
MTAAWYWHPALSRGAAVAGRPDKLGAGFVGYCLAVPANRYAAQLKTIQEVITLSVFAVFSVVYLQQAITWSQAWGSH